MNPFDMLIIIIISFCLIRGLFRGFIKETSSIIGVFGGFYAAFTYYPLLSASKPLSQWIQNPSYLNIVSFMTLFIAVFFIISLLGSAIKLLLKVAFLGWFDRLCGAGFGFFKGILIVSVLLFTFTSFLSRGSPFIGGSLLAPHVTSVSEQMSRMVSSDMKRAFETNLNKFKETWKLRREKT